MNYILAAILGFMLVLNILGANYITCVFTAIMFYLVVTYQSYHYQWISMLSLIALAPIIMLFITAIAYKAPSEVLIYLGFLLFIGVVVLALGLILNVKLPSKFTARYVEKKNADGKTYKTFEYIFNEEKKAVDLLDGPL